MLNKLDLIDMLNRLNMCEDFDDDMKEESLLNIFDEKNKDVLNTINFVDDLTTCNDMPTLEKLLVCIIRKVCD